MRTLAADWIFDGQILQSESWISLDSEGYVVECGQGKAPRNAEKLAGILSPGFVNAHCHLELSHLKGLIPEGTGMAGFITQLQGLRAQFEVPEIKAAAQQAVDDMAGRGIVAVADICNGLHSLPAKIAHPELHFHNFIEVFGMKPDQAQAILERALPLAKAFGPHSSITLHAPYSISRTLRDSVHKYARAREWRQSIHLLESEEERLLFSDLSGPLMDFLRSIGAPFQAHHFDSPIDFVLEGLPEKNPSLLVHCTELESEEMDAIVERLPNAYFVLCPAANWYIHRTLPNATVFARYPDRICIGTDSLASNTQLDIVHELTLLQENFGLPSSLLLQWATSNGALALGLPEEEFRIGVGSKPRLIHLSGVSESNPRFHKDVKVKRITL